MHTFIRILKYATRLPIKVSQFIFFSFLGILFSASTLVLINPMLNILFEQVELPTQIVYPAFSFDINYLLDLFKYYFMTIIRDYGKADALLYVVSCIVISVMIGNFFRYIERIIAAVVRLEIVTNLRKHIFETATSLEIGYFNNKKKGDLISRFTNDIQEVENAVSNSLKAVLKEPITLVVYFATLFFISVKLTLFTLILLPLLGGVLASIIRRLKRDAKHSQESLGRIVNLLDETFGGMRVVKAFNARNYVLKKMDDENLRYKQMNMSISYKNELASPMSEFLGVIIVAFILYFGGDMILSGSNKLSAAEFITFLTIFANVIQPAKSFSNGITSLQKGIASARRIFSIIDTKPAIKNKPNAKILTQFTSSLEFKNVSFAYEKNNVLKKINLKIAKGQTIAFVGPSGGGKSTLLDLVPRFYDPVDGDVLLDGVSLRDYDFESIRNVMGVVTQESILFNDTIFNNIAFGIADVELEAVVKAAKIANAHDFILETENGYQTYIGERGSKLSGGQRQRLSIARAVLKNPSILILDEATSALDSESEKIVQEAIFNLMQNRTSLVIAHRLSTIQQADEIIVLSEGEIVERGNHAELIAKKGVYWKLSTIQTQ